MEEGKVLLEIVKLNSLEQKELLQFHRDKEQHAPYPKSSTQVISGMKIHNDIQSNLTNTEKINSEDQKDPSDDASSQTSNKTSSEEEESAQETYETKDFVETNRSQLTFGKQRLFPGSVQEIDVSIHLKDEILDVLQGEHPVMLRVTARCINSQFNQLDEYVFSVRSNERFEYFEEVRFRIRRKERAMVKVAVKIPPCPEQCLVEGFLEVRLENLAPIFIPINAKCTIPKINCLKGLYKHDENSQVIKIPAKKHAPKLPPIPFKNLSPYPLTLEVQAISNENFGDKPYDIALNSIVSCMANSQFFVNVQLRENSRYEGNKPIRDTFRKILLLKVKNSSVYFHYPIEVHVYQGKVQSNN